ncbi:MAG: hypothetical protein CMJ26_06860 [Phycisphaerae bacterium]|nr:hypothetical protein [Phycisphaerae bacterium]|tara:strand:- start:9947 stop:10798 length:852 start_codon:yes stop_codon:yes gene_type:complete
MQQRNNTHSSQKGFTLIELLIVIAIIAILTALTVVIAGKILDSAKSSKESGALRSVLQGYTLAATDRKGKLLIGYDSPDDIVKGFAGEVIDRNSPASWRYVFRILPYLDNAITSLYINDQKSFLDSVDITSEEYTYIATVFPSFGLNSTWLGGDKMTSNMEFLEPFKIATNYLSGVRNPANQLVFASAKASLENTDSLPAEGHYKITSPYFINEGWYWEGEQGSFIPTNNSADHGFLSARHESKVLTGQLDGSTTFQTIKELLDMRKWNPKAKTSEWTPTVIP